MAAHVGHWLQLLQVPKAEVAVASHSRRPTTGEARQELAYAGAHLDDAQAHAVNLPGAGPCDTQVPDAHRTVLGPTDGPASPNVTHERPDGGSVALEAILRVAGSVLGAVFQHPYAQR